MILGLTFLSVLVCQGQDICPPGKSQLSPYLEVNNISSRLQSPFRVGCATSVRIWHKIITQLTQKPNIAQ